MDNNKLAKEILNLSELKKIALFIFMLIVVLCAWNCDDAYHGFVMAKHLVQGDGFVYNAGERVNAATNTLWILIVSVGYFFIRNIYVVSMILQFVSSFVAAYIVIWKYTFSKLSLACAMGLLCLSNSFISYTTSGLENCLLFLLSGIFCLLILPKDEYDEKDLLKIALCFSSIILTRMDNALIFAPILLYIFLFRRKNVAFLKAVLLGFLGCMPFIMWELFSLFYYGLFVPNTALIKLHTDIPEIIYLASGMQYFSATFLNDSLVVMVPIVCAILLMFKDVKYKMWALGILLYLVYIVYIGGDFMLGRHFTVIYYVSIILLLHVYMGEGNARDLRLLMFGAICSMGVISSMTANTFGREFVYQREGVLSTQIADEREYYFRWTGMINNMYYSIVFNDDLVTRTWNTGFVEDEIKKGNRRIFTNAPGIIVYYYSDIYLQDYYGLGDPLLSHLPAKEESVETFRVGHMRRKTPDGYELSIRNNDNEIVDENLHEFYDIILLITRGDLFDSKRLKAIIDMNLGKYDYLIDRYIENLDG